MKKFIASILFAAVIGTAAFAQAKYAEGIDENLLINVGVGYGFSSYDMGIPPLSASVDFKLPISLPITVGGTFAFRTQTYSTGAGNSSIDVTYTDLVFGARGMWHFDWVKNFDIYAGLTLGYAIQSADVKYGSYYDSYAKPSYDGVSYFVYGVNAGGRYFFTKTIGAYLELGYSGFQVASAGLTLKF